MDEIVRDPSVDYSEQSWNIASRDGSTTKDFEEAQETMRDLETREPTPEEMT